MAMMKSWRWWGIRENEGIWKKWLKKKRMENRNGEEERWKKSRDEERLKIEEWICEETVRDNWSWKGKLKNKSENENKKWKERVKNKIEMKRKRWGMWREEEEEEFEKRWRMKI